MSSSILCHPIEAFDNELSRFGFCVREPGLRGEHVGAVGTGAEVQGFSQAGAHEVATEKVALLASLPLSDLR
ncbi:hypothetical protein ACIBI8_23170 [Streptomyces sp. NPDC050529]|uniref:hypothetical protein n=1 Tax=unclassified Streptomyces TaxID=2593676 RepID=UPI002DDB3000|nr:hypothetical protein [Streptomyces sp. NBC_01022]WRZ79555.1 hypothetical protein OG316_04400 [Streptomyces sp. NBC_01022]